MPCNRIRQDHERDRQKVVARAQMDFEIDRVDVEADYLIIDRVIAGAGVHDDAFDAVKDLVAALVTRDDDAAGAFISNGNAVRRRIARDEKRVAELPGGTRAGARFEDFQARPDVNRPPDLRSAGRFVKSSAIPHDYVS